VKHEDEGERERGRKYNTKVDKTEKSGKSERRLNTGMEKKRLLVKNFPGFVHSSF
jgi:hypothetical protein